MSPLGKNFPMAPPAMAPFGLFDVRKGEIIQTFLSSHFSSLLRTTRAGKKEGRQLGLAEMRVPEDEDSEEIRKGFTDWRGLSVKNAGFPDEIS